MVDAVVLIAFGGPTARDEIRPFLANVTRGRSISGERLEEVEGREREDLGHGL